MARTDEDEVIHEDGVEIHGDMLEVILSHVPLIDLVPASQVSKSWCCAVASGLRHLNKPKPWLILHKQATNHPSNVSTYVYDPRSHVWMKMVGPWVKFISNLKSSHSNFVYSFSFSKLSFSFDPLNLTWSHVHPPFGWRTDPIVARIGDSIIVVGGGYDYESDLPPVEIYNINTCTWYTCDNMPRTLLDLPASTCLSIATTKEKLFVTDRQSGLTYWFDLKSKLWSRCYTLSPGQPINVVDYNIGTLNEDLILVGLCKNVQNVEQVKIWKVVKENFQCEEIGEMRYLYVEKLKGSSFEISSINARVIGNLVYIYNPLKVEEIVVCEFITTTSHGCRWWSTQNVVVPDEKVSNRQVFTCLEVGFDELKRVMWTENLSFTIEP